MGGLGGVWGLVEGGEGGGGWGEVVGERCGVWGVGDWGWGWDGEVVDGWCGGDERGEWGGEGVGGEVECEGWL